MPKTTSPSSAIYSFRRIDAARNMARFYMLSIEPTLFGEVAILCHWGRIGARGRQTLSLHATMSDATLVLYRQVERRRRRGYVEV